MRTHFIYFFILIPMLVFTQEKTISFDIYNVPILNVLNKIESNFDVRFSYNDSIVSNQIINLKVENYTLDEVIAKLNASTSFQFEIVSKKHIVILKNNDSTINNHFLDEVVIKNYLTKGIEKQKDGSFHISPKKLDILPGIPEFDIFQSLHLLPGISSPEETSTGIYVRGGSPDQNLTLWDGIKIYHSGHLFGTFSAFNPYVTTNVKFINKGTDAIFGDRISSVIDIQTNNTITDKFHGGVGFNMVEFDGYFELPIIKDKLSILASARRSFTDALLSDTYMEISKKVFQHSSFSSQSKNDQSFFYFDYNIKVNWLLSKNNLINFSYLNIENELDDNFLNEVDNSTIDNKLETENSGINLNWQKTWNPRFSHQINAYQSKYGLKYFQITNIENNQKDEIEKTNTVNDMGINFNFEYQLNNIQKLLFGYQFSNNNVRYTISKTSDLSNHQILNTHSIYSSYQYINDKLFDFTTGLRLNYYHLLDRLVVEPRVVISKKLYSGLSFNLSAEIKTQAVSQINESISNSLNLENQLWAISNNSQFPILKSLQYTAGFSYSKNKLNFEVDAYFKEIEGLTTLNNGFLDIESFEFNQGESIIKGLDFYAKKEFDNNYQTWVSYTLNSINNHFEEINEDKSFPSNIDIRHNFYWSNAYSINQFQFALGWRLYSGKPFSKAIGIETNNQGNKFLVYEGINQNRLPNYSRVDFSSTYKFNLNKEKNIKGKLGISVLNLFNKNNILNKSYNLNPDADEINTINTISLERVFNLVFRVSW